MKDFPQPSKEQANVRGLEDGAGVGVDRAECSRASSKWSVPDAPLSVRARFSDFFKAIGDVPLDSDLPT